MIHKVNIQIMKVLKYREENIGEEGMKSSP